MIRLNITPLVQQDSERLDASLQWAENRAKTREPDARGVYVFECEGFIKVGIAKDVRQRLNNARSNCPFEIRLVSFRLWDDAAARERHVHRVLSEAGYHVRGEWFKVPIAELAKLL